MKLKSRKFIAWIFSSIVLLFFVFTKSDHTSVFIPWWGGITMVWVGSQGGIDLVEKLKK